MIAKPSSLNWLSEELIETIESHRPRESISSTNPVDESEMIAAFESFFDEIPQFENMYQLHQAINYLGDFYGFTTRYSGYKIICACGKNHQQKKSLADASNTMGFVAPDALEKKRKRNPVSGLDCPMFVSCSPISRPVAGDGIKKEDRIVKVSKMSLHHNHSLTKKMLIKAKKTTHQYTVRPEVLRKILEMLDSGPIPTKTLRSFLQKQFPPTVKITSVMVANVRMMAQKLKIQYGHDTNLIPNDAIRKVFHVNSLENAPEDWDSDPILADIYKNAMMDVLSGDDVSFPLARIMEKIKEAQTKGYDYRIFLDSDSRRPQGVMHMVPAMIKAFLRYGDICALDVQARHKNTYGWSGCFPSGTNNNNKLQNFCDALAISETDEFYAWVLTSMCDISQRPIESIKIISVDGKLSVPLFMSHVPSEFYYFFCICISKLT
jgi:hypothetical protein